MSFIKLRAPQMARPADTTQYAASDLVANSTTAGAVVPLAFGTIPGEMMVRGGVILSSNDTVTAAAFSLYLFSVSPTVTNGDNGAFAVTAANAKNLMGILGGSVSTATGGGKMTRLCPIDGAGTFLGGAPPVICSGSIYGLIKVNGTYTPTSAETFDVVIAAEAVS